MDIRDLQDRLAEFAGERDWDQFHSPKNLSMALAAEAAELLEIFQWLTEEQSKGVTGDPGTLKSIQEELADIFIYLVRLADKLGIDLDKAVHEKIRLNELKYPTRLSKGNATKYNRRE